MVIRTRDDISKFEAPTTLEDHPAFVEPLKCLKILHADSAGRFPICAYLTSSMTLPAMLMRMEKWMELLLLGASTLRDELLMKCSDIFGLLARTYRDVGADLLTYNKPSGSTNLIPLKFRQHLSLR